MRRLDKHELWIGNVGDLRDVRTVMATGIAAVLELADNEPLATLPRELLRFRFPLSDGGPNAAWMLRLAVDCLATLIRERVPTLVCCSCGLNRSLCLAAAGVALADEGSFEETLVRLATTGPADVSPALFEQMRAALDS